MQNTSKICSKNKEKLFAFDEVFMVLWIISFRIDKITSKKIIISIMCFRKFSTYIYVIYMYRRKLSGYSVRLVVALKWFLINLGCGTEMKNKSKKVFRIILGQDINLSIYIETPNI